MRWVVVHCIASQNCFWHTCGGMVVDEEAVVVWRRNKQIVIRRSRGRVWGNKLKRVYSQISVDTANKVLCIANSSSVGGSFWLLWHRLSCCLVPAYQQRWCGPGHLLQAWELRIIESWNSLVWKGLQWSFSFSLVANDHTRLAISLPLML